MQHLNAQHKSVHLNPTPLIAYLHSQVGRELDKIPLHALLHMDLAIVELFAIAMSRCRAGTSHDDEIVIHFRARARHTYNDAKLRKFMIDYVHKMVDD